MTRPFAQISGGIYVSSLGLSHFRIEEFTCHDGCGACQVDLALIDTLEAIRSMVKAPIHVLSGVRCLAHNTAVEGKVKSQHLPRTPEGEIRLLSGTQEGAGRAADITVRTLTPKKLQSLIRNNRTSLGVKGLGCYVGFTHVDTRTGAYVEWVG